MVLVKFFLLLAKFRSDQKHFYSIVSLKDTLSNSNVSIITKTYCTRLILWKVQTKLLKFCQNTSLYKPICIAAKSKMLTLNIQLLYLLCLVLCLHSVFMFNFSSNTVQRDFFILPTFINSFCLKSSIIQTLWSAANCFQNKFHSLIMMTKVTVYFVLKPLPMITFYTLNIPPLVQAKCYTWNKDNSTLYMWNVLTNP